MLSALGTVVYSALLRQELPTTAWARVLHRVLHAARRGVIACGDPVVSMPVGGMRMRMHLSHNLPLYQRAWPRYDRALPRLVSAIADAQGSACVIDVGANIGDTACAILQDSRTSVLSVEADDKYYPLLVANTAPFGDRVTCVRACCDDAMSTATMTRVRGGGTTRLVAGGSGAALPPTCTLDRIVADVVPGFPVDLVKVDTDGFDFKVLRGARSLLDSRAPVLFFEWDPAFLRQQDEDPFSLFPWLAARGYQSAFLYDNFGMPTQTVALDDVARLRQLADRIDGRAICYYDVVVIRRDARPFIREFLAREHQGANSEDHDA